MHNVQLVDTNTHAENSMWVMYCMLHTTVTKGKAPGTGTTIIIPTTETGMMMVGGDGVKGFRSEIRCHTGTKT
jgi:hypothetical protein